MLCPNCGSNFNVDDGAIIEFDVVFGAEQPPEDCGPNQIKLQASILSARQRVVIDCPFCAAHYDFWEADALLDKLTTDMLRSVRLTMIFGRQ